MLNIIIIFVWLFTPILIFKNSKVLPYLLFGSFSISIFDNPFNINVSYFYYFGFCYFIIFIFSQSVIINSFLLYFIIYNTIVSLLFYLFNYNETSASFSLIIYTYLVSQFKIISLFGIYYYLKHIKLNISYFNYYFIPPLLFSLFVGYIIYFGIDSPYYLLKNFGYSTNGSTNFNLIRLSGLTQEPRYLAYLIVFTLFTLQFYNNSFNKNFILKIFLLFSLFLTKSLSGFILFLFALFIKLVRFFNFYNLLFLLFLILIIFIFFYNSSFIYFLEQRIFNRRFIDFYFLPDFFSYFEHHDLIALYFLENNFLVTLFGMGYGQIKNYEAVYAMFIDPSMTLFRLNSTIHCCDPQSSLINFISSFGIFNTIFFLIFYFRIARFNNIFFAFIIFNLFNLPPGPLPLFIMIFALLHSSKN